MSYSERLKKCRNERKLTQEQLSSLLKFNRSTYAKYETGENQPDYDTLQKLADFFEVSTDYLLGRIDDPFPPDHSSEGLAFLGGPDESLSEDEKEHLRESLEQFRKLKAKFLASQQKKND